VSQHIFRSSFYEKQVFLWLPFFIVLLGNPPALWAQAREKFEKQTSEEITYYLERDLNSNYLKTETYVGAIFTSGNVEQISVDARSNTVYRIKRFKNEFDLGAYYNRKFFDSNDPLDPPETLAKYIFGTYRLDYFLTQDTTYFIGGGGYSDQIKGIPLGGRAFTGVSHYFIWTDKTALNLSGGYEVIGERRENDPRRILHTAKVKLAVQRKLTSTSSFAFYLDSLKAFNELDQWLIGSGLQFQLKLYKILTLFAGVNVRYDNVPTTGFRKLDTISNLSIGISYETPKPSQKEPEAAP